MASGLRSERRRGQTLAAATALLLSMVAPMAGAVEVDTGAPATTSSLPKQTVIFYNARVALRERRPAEVLRLWLLHNTVANNLGEPGTHDPAFRSVVWAALGDMGLCADGLPRDADDAGLWPLALHNWVVHNMVQPRPDSPTAPFDAFEVGRQQRLVSLFDVLSARELRSVTFFRTACLLPARIITQIGEPLWADFKDREHAARLLRHLLVTSRTTLARDKIREHAVIEARIFDLDLMLAELAAREARKEARAQAREAKRRGVSDPALKELVAEMKPFTFAEGSEQAAILRASLGWSVDEWLSLSREQRLFLFSQARKLSADPEAEKRLVLGIVDALIDKDQGSEIELWMGWLDAGRDPGERRQLWAGERGLALLGLDAASGFRERAAIALHRGVAFLEEGDLRESLRSFAYALRYAPESRQSETTAALSRRWLSYVLGQHETTGELIATVAALVPRQDFNAIIEDLAWRAALRADQASYLECTSRRTGQTAFDRRVERLRPLASGQRGAFLTELRSGLATEPYATLRFLKLLLERLEAEDGDVRAAHVPTLEGIIGFVNATTPAAGTSKAHLRTAEAIVGRAQAILDGITDVASRDDASTNARGLSPTREVFAGNVRLAPADALPWPFTAPSLPAPSVFTPLALEPVEWRGPGGDIVFGWKIGE